MLNRTPRILFFAQIVVLGAVLAGCSPVERTAPTTEDLVGVWVNGDTQLVLAEDGTFTLSDAPASTQVGLGDQWRDGASPVWGETGEWNLESDAVRIRGPKLYYEYRDSELILEFGLDLGSDNPRCFQLVREGSSLEALGPEECSIRA